MTSRRGDDDDGRQALEQRVAELEKKLDTAERALAEAELTRHIFQTIIDR